MLDPTTPVDENGIDNGVKVSELAGHIRQFLNKYRNTAR